VECCAVSSANTNPPWPFEHHQAHIKEIGMIKKIDHIGVVVNDIEEALKVYQQALGLSLAKIKERPDQAVTIAFLLTGESEIELIQPLTSDSGVAKFLQKRGEGIHHICLEVDDIEKALADLRDKGLQLIDEMPRTGPEGERFAFIHPKSTHGVLIELYEYPKSTTAHE
jgi:methylmalonyl-CoA epimerase